MSRLNRYRYGQKKRARETAPDPTILRDCPQAKLAYRTLRIAKEAIANIFKYNGKQMWTYKCKHCHLWHLTSREPW